jgi:hypothetical protein
MAFTYKPSSCNKVFESQTNLTICIPHFVIIPSPYAITYYCRVQHIPLPHCSGHCRIAVANALYKLVMYDSEAVLRVSRKQSDYDTGSERYVHLQQWDVGDDRCLDTFSNYSSVKSSCIFHSRSTVIMYYSVLK